MEEALIAYLLAHVPLTPLVGRRIRPSIAKQGEGFPSVVVTMVSHLPEYVTQGPVSLADSRVQVDCYAETFAASKAVARAVKACLSGQRFTSVGVEFQQCAVIAERSSFEDGKEVKLHRTSIDFRVWHTQP
jgi:hypothetical protein